VFSDFLRAQLDLTRASGELGMAMFSGHILRRIAPRTDRNLPVIALPGLMASDASFEPLSRFLREQGFNAQTWGLGRNRGLRGAAWNENLAAVRARLADRIKEMSDASSAPVSLVGHSMGGIYARELAARMEGEVDRVITLGAPTLHPYRAARHNQFAMDIADLINRQRAAELGGRTGLLHWDPDQPALPCVAIHSPIDAFVDEEHCHIPAYIVTQSTPASPRENIRVLSSHLGMTVNPFVMLAVADRLVVSRDNWCPFDPDRYFKGLFRRAAGVFYPEPGKLWKNRGTSAFVEMNQ
jgi:pimeloyl-ACP methyl ester carboxylesterase